MDDIIHPALKKAIEDYNFWASKRGKSYDPVKAFNELRGIFYNKLYSRMREVWNKDWSSLKRTITPNDIICEFQQGGFLKKLSFNEPRYGMYHRIYQKTDFMDREHTLSILSEGASNIIIDHWPEKEYYIVLDAVNNIIKRSKLRL